MSVSDTNPSATHTQYFTITIKDEKDNPVQNAEVSISCLWQFLILWAMPSFTTALHQKPPFIATTNADGVYYLRVDYLSGGGGTSFTSNLEIRSGSAFAFGDINRLLDRGL